MPPGEGVAGAWAPTPGHHPPPHPVGNAGPVQEGGRWLMDAAETLSGLISDLTGIVLCPPDARVAQALHVVLLGSAWPLSLELLAALQELRQPLAERARDKLLRASVQLLPHLLLMQPDGVKKVGRRGDPWPAGPVGPCWWTGYGYNGWGVSALVLFPQHSIISIV